MLYGYGQCQENVSRNRQNNVVSALKYVWVRGLDVQGLDREPQCATIVVRKKLSYSNIVVQSSDSYLTMIESLLLCASAVDGT